MTRVNTNLLKPLLRDYLIDYKHVNLNGNFNCIAPNHEDSHPSMNYSDDYNCCHCFACGKTYTLFSLIAEDNNLDVKEDFKLILEKISELYPEAYKKALNNEEIDSLNIQKTKKEISTPPQDYSKYYEMCHRNAKRTEYFAKRGISEEMIEKYNLGYDEKNQLCVFPINKNCMFRRSTISDAKLNSSGTLYCWGEEKLKGSSENDFVIITEAIIDAISLEQVNNKYPVISINGVSNYPKFLKAIKHYDYKGNVIIATDNDAIGEIKGKEIKQALDEAGIKCSFYYPFTHDYKDINEAYLNNPQELINSYNYLSETLDLIVEQIYNQNKETINQR